MTNKSITSLVNSHLFGDVTPDTIAVIGRFLILWGIYEKHFHSTVIRDKQDNIKKIDIKFKDSHVKNNKNIIISDIDTPFNYLKNRYGQDTEISKSRYNSLEINGSYDSDILLILKNDSTKYEKSFVIQLIIYQLRNNLFHGKKGAGSLNDNKKNFELMSSVLIDIMSKI